MLLSLLKHYLELYITDTALKVSRSLYGFTTSIFHSVEIISQGCGVRASLMLLFYDDIKAPVLYFFFWLGSIFQQLVNDLIRG